MNILCKFAVSSLAIGVGTIAFATMAAAQSQPYHQPDAMVHKAQYGCEPGLRVDAWGRCVPYRRFPDVVILTPDGRWHDARENWRYHHQRNWQEDGRNADGERYYREDTNEPAQYRRMPDTDEQY